jgi:hypothetical protein
MSPVKCLVTLMVLALAALSAVPGGAQTSGSPSGEDLRVEWTVLGAAPAQPVIEGYVTNPGGWWARRVRLTVEALDASGRAVGHSTLAVPGEVGPGGRVFFCTRPGTPAASYRVSVLSFDRVDPSQT